MTNQALPPIYGNYTEDFIEAFKAFDSWCQEVSERVLEAKIYAKQGNQKDFMANFERVAGLLYAMHLQLTEVGNLQMDYARQILTKRPFSANKTATKRKKKR